MKKDFLKEQFDLEKAQSIWKPEMVVVGTKTVIGDRIHETYHNEPKKGLKTQIRGYLKDGYLMQYDNDRKSLYLGLETEDIKIYYVYMYCDLKDLF